MPWYSFNFSTIPKKELKHYDFVEASLIRSLDNKQQIVLKISDLTEAKNIKSGLFSCVMRCKEQLLKKHSELPTDFKYTYKENPDHTGAEICLCGDLEEAITQLLLYEALNLNETNSLLKKIGSPFQFKAAGEHRYDREIRPQEKKTTYPLELEEHEQPTSRASSNSI